jgi:ring-1,2-phenylacetyl-CoA epoxidase subunit PaaC
LTEIKQPEAALLTLADTLLLWGHRLSEWCGHGPALEEDIALTNTALDVIGQARAMLQLVAVRRGDGATEDALAYFREPDAFCNLMIAALPNGDYAFTIARSFLLSAWFVPVWQSLAQGADGALANIAADAVKESRVQLRHAGDWVVRFGDGTDESRRRIDAAFASLWPYCDELLATTIDGTDQAERNAAWRASIKATIDVATLSLPMSHDAQVNLLKETAREGRATLLAEMQSLARQHPGASW